MEYSEMLNDSNIWGPKRAVSVWKQIWIMPNHKIAENMMWTSCLAAVMCPAGNTPGCGLKVLANTRYSGVEWFSTTQTASKFVLIAFAQLSISRVHQVLIIQLQALLSWASQREVFTFLIKVEFTLVSGRIWMWNQQKTGDPRHTECLRAVPSTFGLVHHHHRFDQSTLQFLI